MQKSVKTDMLFIIVTSAKVESGKLGTGIEVAFGPFRAFQSSTDAPVLLLSAKSA